MAYVNALLVLFGVGLVIFGVANEGGFGLAVAISGCVAVLAGTALIVLTRRVADLEDRRDDQEEHRNVGDRSV